MRQILFILNPDNITVLHLLNVAEYPRSDVKNRRAFAEIHVYHQRLHIFQETCHKRFFDNFGYGFNAGEGERNAKDLPADVKADADDRTFRGDMRLLNGYEGAKAFCGGRTHFRYRINNHNYYLCVYRKDMIVCEGDVFLKRKAAR